MSITFSCNSITYDIKFEKGIKLKSIKQPIFYNGLLTSLLGLKRTTNKLGKHVRKFKSSSLIVCYGLPRVIKTKQQLSYWCKELYSLKKCGGVKIPWIFQNFFKIHDFQMIPWQLLKPMMFPWNPWFPEERERLHTNGLQKTHTKRPTSLYWLATW